MNTVDNKLLYDKVIQYIRKNIMDGTFAPGKKFPSERTLSETLGVSRVTTRKAISALLAEQVLEHVSTRRISVSSMGLLQQVLFIYHRPVHRLFEGLNSINAGSIAGGVIAEADRLGIQVRFTHPSQKNFNSLIKSLNKGTVGVIVYRHVNELHPELVVMLRERNIPFVVVDSHLEDFSNVSADVETGAYAAIKYLTENGHKAIGFVCGDRLYPASSLMEKGYRRALLEAGIEIDASLIRRVHCSVYPVSDYPEKAVEEIKVFFKLGVDAVFITEDYLFHSINFELQKVGGQKPVIFASGDAEWLRLFCPGTGCVDENRIEQGREAIEVLRALFTGQKDNIQRLVPCRLIRPGENVDFSTLDSD